MSGSLDLAELASRAVEHAIRAVPGADVEASIDRNRLDLTRFANSVIHQNVAEDVVTASVRVHLAGRTCSGSATVVNERDVEDLITRTADAVVVAPLDPAWPGVGPDVADDRSTSAPLDDVDPATRARAVRDFVDGAAGLETAGFCRTSTWEGAFANSAGRRATGAATECGMSAIARTSTSAGTADGVARFAPLHIADLDAARLGRRAADKALAWDDPIELPPGRYEVVLEPTAVADLVETLAISGFNGKAVNERRSFVRVGEAQLDPSITLVDDPLALGYHFDAEGTPRHRMALVESGVIRAVTHDRRTAAEAGSESTGHAGAVRFAFGPFARHLALVAAGGAATTVAEVEGPIADSSIAELVARVDRGILVSDLWYTRLLDPRSLAVTGLTRNGVWLIEAGEVTAPVGNFRFTQSYAQALMPGNVLGVGRVATPVPGDTYTARSPRWTCPALHLASWNFTGGASG
jgi:predicted Zn-dependent protease